MKRILQLLREEDSVFVRLKLALVSLSLAKQFLIFGAPRLEMFPAPPPDESHEVNGQSHHAHADSAFFPRSQGCHYFKPPALLEVTVFGNSGRGNCTAGTFKSLGCFHWPIIRTVMFCRSGGGVCLSTTMLENKPE